MIQDRKKRLRTGINRRKTDINKCIIWVLISNLKVKRKENLTTQASM